MTIDDSRLHRIVDAVHASPGDLTVTFNYRYSPRNSVVRQLIADGAIGEVTSVHFEWLLDTAHGADYFRRWHRRKDISGGLLVHKSTHHFDLVNWWLADVPTRVYASGGLKFYGKANADARGLGERTPLSRDNDPTTRSDWTWPPTRCSRVSTSTPSPPTATSATWTCSTTASPSRTAST